MDNGVFDDLVVVKRSGQRVAFNGNKIAIAVKNAFDSLDSEYSSSDVNIVYIDVLEYIKKNYVGRKTINVEDIQDIIEAKLKSNKFNLVYEAFNGYRLRRSAFRDVFSEKQQHKFVKAIEKLGLQNNKNLDNKPLRTMVGFGETISKEFARAYLVENKYVRSCDEGLIYIHDLSYYPICSIRSCHLNYESIKSSDIDSYINKIKDTIRKTKNEIIGEHVIDAIDNLLKNVLVDNYKSVFLKKIISYLKINGLYEFVNVKQITMNVKKINSIDFDFNNFKGDILNDHIKSIFISCHNDTIDDIKSILAKSFKELILDVEEFDYEINDNKVTISIGSYDSSECKLIEDIYLDVLLSTSNTKNLCTIYKIDQINKINPKVFRLINENKNICFSFNNHVEFFSGGEKIYANINDDDLSSRGRYILSKTSINMARLGINNRNKSLDDFYKELSDLLDFTKNQLIQRFDYQGNKYKRNFPNLFKYNLLLDADKLDDNQKIRKVLRNGVLNIGLVGLKECVSFLPEKNKDKLLSNILKFINDKVVLYTNDNKLNFIVSETYDIKVLRTLYDIDKTIYGNNFFNGDSYSLLGKYELDKLNTYNNIQDLINIRIDISIRKNSSEQKIIEVMNLIKKLGIVYFKINSGKNEN